MGKVTLSVVSSDPERMLRTIEKANIAVSSVKKIDDLTLHLQVNRSDEHHLCALLEKFGSETKLVRKEGIYWEILSLSKRPVILCALAVILLAGFYLPTRIYFFNVEGNCNVPTSLILEAAEHSGIRFGALAKNVRSERMKNALLERIPQLQWAGINTAGCVATIHVKEKEMEDISPALPSVSSIVAVRDGIISNITVTDGNSVCKIGQAVSKGQVLISGYMNTGQSIRATRASGEIYASTIHKIEALIPSEFIRRVDFNQKIQKFSIIFGKKRINFYSGSGILDSSCVKMYEENCVTLSGGFQLPIKIVTETWMICQEKNDKIAPEQNAQILSTIAKRYLKECMIAGSFHFQREQFSAAEGVLCLTGEYGCIEMIGREQNEEIITP